LKRVLVVPDQVVPGEIGSTFFDRRSFSVRAAHHADEALAIATAWRPDLVVFRSDLEGASARAFCTTTRAAVPHVKLLMVSETLGGDDPNIEGLCDGRLVHPISAEQLLTTSAELLQIRTRRAPRAHIETLVHLTGFGLPGHGPGTLANAIDVSELGILLEASVHLEIGSAGTLSFFIPGHNERLVTRAEVRVALDEVLLHYAMEFIDADEQATASLRHYVAEQR
jgi:DNA-binding response OmpR family regulator